MSAKKRRVLAITLDDYTAGLIAKAEQVMKREDDPKFRNWVAKWAIMAVLREVIETEEVPVPFGVQFRAETVREQVERCGPQQLPFAQWQARLGWKPGGETTEEGVEC